MKCDHGVLTNLTHVGLVSEFEAKAKNMTNYGNDYCGDTNAPVLLPKGCSRYLELDEIHEGF